LKAVAIIPGKKGSLRLIDVPKPEVKDYEILVEVKQVGVCGTDFELYEGLYGEPPENSPYLIIGHESVAKIVETGEHVQGFYPGDYVVCSVRRPCPENCLNCRNGEFDMCLTGNYKERGIKGVHGFMSEYYSDTQEYFIKVPDEIEDLGVFVELLSVIEKAVDHIFKLQRRALWNPEIGVVLGAGPLGLLATMVLTSMGIKTYTVSRGTKETLKAKLAEETGAEYISTQDVPVDVLGEELGNIDLIIEATGSSNVVFKAISALGKNGVMAVTGIPSGNKTFTIDGDRLNNKLVFDNNVIFGVINANKQHYQSAIDRLLKHKEKWAPILKRMITCKVPLNKADEVFRNPKGHIKPVIQISG